MSSGPYPTLGQQTGTRFPQASNSEVVGFEPTATLEPVVDSEEAARFLNINPKTLQKMARNGRCLGIASESSGSSASPIWTRGFVPR